MLISMRSITKLVCLLVSLFALTSQCCAQHMNANNSPCKDVVVTMDAANCFAAAYKKSDTALNAEYRRVQTVVNGAELEKLKAAQRLWIEFRDANCDAEYELYGGGSAGPVVKLACLEAVTRHRVEELKEMYNWRLEK